jgi:hypothetical protein
MNRKNIFTKYKPEYCNMLIEYAAKGFTWITFAAEINVSKSTLYEWLKKYPEFLEAKEIAEVRCEQFWEKKGLKPKSKDFHFGVYKLMMTQKLGYTNKRTEEKENSVIILPPLEE